MSSPLGPYRVVPVCTYSVPGGEKFGAARQLHGLLVGGGGEWDVEVWEEHEYSDWGMFVNPRGPRPLASWLALDVVEEEEWARVFCPEQDSLTAGLVVSVVRDCVLGLFSREAGRNRLAQWAEPVVAGEIKARVAEAWARWDRGEFI